MTLHVEAPPSRAMTFPRAVRSVLVNYAKFTGRAARPEYWWWAYAMFCLSITLAAAPYLALGIDALNGVDTPAFGVVLVAALLISVALIVPSIAVTVRRLRDGGNHWAWIFIAWVPFAGPILLLILLAQPTAAGAFESSTPRPDEPTRARDVLSVTLAALTTAATVIASVAVFALSSMNTETDGDSAGGRPPADAMSFDLPADIEVEPKSWECSDGKDCWAWNVTAAEDCDRVEITFGLASSDVGASERTETRIVHGWYAGSPRLVTLNLDPQPLQYAGIDKLVCTG